MHCIQGILYMRRRIMGDIITHGIVEGCQNVIIHFFIEE